MATLTLEDLSTDLLACIEAVARTRGITAEEEVKGLLEDRYARRDVLLARLRTRWGTVSAPRVEEVERWIEQGRGT